MALVREHAFLCSDEGVQTIRDDIEKEAVTHVMIAACSRRAKTEAFHFPAVAMARANLREGVLWAVAEGSEHDEVRQEMAADYVRMGCAELKKMKLPAGNADTGKNRRILVVGRRHLRHDRGARGGRDRLRRRARRKGGGARRLGREAVEARAVEGAVRRAAGHRRRGDGGAGRARIRASTCTSAQPSRRPPARPAASTCEIAQRRRDDRRGSRRDRPDHRLRVLRHRQAAGTRRRQERPTSSTRPGSRRWRRPRTARRSGAPTAAR